MPQFDRDTPEGRVSLYYAQSGSGFPILLFAPGGMRSVASMWRTTPWDPVVDLRDRYRVIEMDQRNAGQSVGPVTAADGWHTFTADHIALLDHLGIDQVHVMGMCIGGPYCLGLAAAQPQRVASAVLFQTIGLDGNREAFEAMFDSWRTELAPARPEVPAAAWDTFRSNMYGGDAFLFNLDRAAIRTLPTPMLVLMGDDRYHPQSTSRALVAVAANAELVEQWKQGSQQAAARERVRAFLARHTPA